MSPEKIKVQLYLEPALVKRIDQYWHKEMLRTRQEAVRELLEKSLDAEKSSRKGK